MVHTYNFIVKISSFVLCVLLIKLTMRKYHQKPLFYKSVCNEGRNFINEVIMSVSSMYDYLP